VSAAAQGIAGPVVPGTGVAAALPSVRACRQSDGPRRPVTHGPDASRPERRTGARCAAAAAAAAAAGGGAGGAGAGAGAGPLVDPHHLDGGHRRRPPGPLRRDRLGPPALFLPRRGLGPRAYAPCHRGHGRGRVPGRRPGPARFGGTPELPSRSARSPATAPGSPVPRRRRRRRPRTRGGHSFGAGCRRPSSTTSPSGCVAPPGQRHRQPDVGAAAERGADDGPAPAVDWGRHFGREPPPLAACAPDTPHAVGDFLPNVLHNPLGKFRTGEVIRRADLVGRGAVGDRRQGHPGVGGLVGPRRPRPPLGLRRPAPARPPGVEGVVGSTAPMRG